MDAFKIYNDDSYKKIDDFLQESIMVDHIITDPPYNISQDNNFATMRHPRTGIDFGEWDRGKFDLFGWIPQYAKILKPNGSMIIFCSYRYLSHVIDALESDESGMVVKDVIVWQKSNPMPRNIDRRYVQDMEFAVWAVRKNAKWVFNKLPNRPYNRAFFTTPVVSGTERVGHPTQKSLKLMEELILIHTNKEELILDPFMGSGTTGVACVNSNRNFIGIELNEEYFRIAEKRINDAVAERECKLF